MKKTLTALLLALALLTGGAAAFSDVDGGLYYAAPIAWAVERGITTGTSESTFSPDSLCTRGQIITFLWRAVGRPEPEREEKTEFELSGLIAEELEVMSRNEWSVLMKRAGLNPDQYDF